VIQDGFFAQEIIKVTANVFFLHTCLLSFFTLSFAKSKH